MKFEHWTMKGLCCVLGAIAIGIGVDVALFIVFAVVFSIVELAHATI